MDLSIIIINFNTKDLLKNCLRSVFKTLKDSPLNLEVIVVDNDSSDGSVKYLRDLKQGKFKETEESSKSLNLYKSISLKVIFNDQNLGFGRANNQALRQAQGEYVLLLNSDTEVINGAVESLLEFVRNNKEADIAGGKLFNKNGSPQASCGPFYSLPICFLMLFLQGDRLRLTRWSPKKIREVDWVSGACLMAKRDLFKKLSFDENIFMYMDEIDFLYRAKKMGFRVFFYPKAHFLHLGAASCKEKKNPILNVYRGLLYFYKKHHSGLQMVVLKLMLKAKAAVAYCLGILIGSSYLKKTYAEALILVR